MRPSPSLFIIGSSVVFAAVFFAGRFAQSVPPTADSKTRVFEIRTYTTTPGNLPALLKRFHDHTTKLFEKHGMTNVGYWVPTDEPRSKDTLIYVLAHASREAAKKNWDAFKSDPEWIKIRDASEAKGKLVVNVASIYAEPTDFSAIK